MGHKVRDRDVGQPEGAEGKREIREKIASEIENRVQTTRAGIMWAIALWFIGFWRGGSVFGRGLLQTFAHPTTTRLRNRGWASGQEQNTGSFAE